MPEVTTSDGGPQRVLGLHSYNGVQVMSLVELVPSSPMCESGFATCDETDTGMVQVCPYPVGPLALTTSFALDSVKAVRDSLHERVRAPGAPAPLLLSRIAKAGLLEQKTGGGFYEYAR